MEQIGDVEGFGFEVLAVGGDEEPVADDAAQEIDSAKRREFFAEFSVGWICLFGEDEPDAVVLWGLCVVTEHADDLVSEVYGVAAKHVADFGVEWGEGFEEEFVGWGFALGFGGWFDVGAAGHGGRIVGWIGVVL